MVKDVGQVVWNGRVRVPSSTGSLRDARSDAQEGITHCEEQRW